VFDWPDDGQLHLTGLTNTPQSIFLLADSAAKTFPFSRNDELLTIDGPAQAPDSINTVVVLDIPGMPEVIEPPSILAVQPRFTDYVDVSLKSESKDVDIYYTLDGSLPTPSSRKGTGPIRLEQSCTVTARCYRSAKPASASSSALFQKVAPLPAVSTGVTSPGLRFKYYEGDWDTLPDFGRLRVVKGGVVPTVRQDPRLNEERYGFLYEGYIRIPEDGVYTFYLESDDGSRLEIGGTAIVDNDGLHGMIEREGTVALAAGYHPLRVSYFEKNGGDGIAVSIMSRALEKRPVPEEMLVH
jgi:alpha-L-fucosidase